jgi:hypothetical protein
VGIQTYHTRRAIKQAFWRIWKNGARVALTEDMQASTFIGLLEEMVDIKVQQQTEARLKTTPEIAAVLHQKRETDRRRLDQIRAELVRILGV